MIKNVDHWILCNDDDNPKIIPLENIFTNTNYIFLFEKVVVSVSQSGEGNFNLNTVSNKPESITNLLGKRRAVVTAVKISRESSSKKVKTSGKSNPIQSKVPLQSRKELNIEQIDENRQYSV